MGILRDSREGFHEESLRQLMYVYHHSLPRESIITRPIPLMGIESFVCEALSEKETKCKAISVPGNMQNIHDLINEKL